LGVISPSHHLKSPSGYPDHETVGIHGERSNGGVMADSERCTGELIDWTSAIMEPMVAGGFIFIVSGESPVPVEVCLDPEPIGVVEEDYRKVAVRGTVTEVQAQVVTPWRVETTASEEFNGRIGFELIGKTKRAFFPPREDQ
jgi:hypothetical protein